MPGRPFTESEAVSVDAADPALLAEIVDGWNSSFRDGGGNFGAASLEAEKLCRAVLAAAKTKGLKRPFEADTPADHAAKFLDLHAHAKAFIAKGDADLAAMAAFQAAVLVARAELGWRFEVDALRGIKVKDAQKAGHEAVHGTEAEKQARWSAMARDLQGHLATGMKKMAAETAVAASHGVSTKTVRRAAKDYLKKP